MNYTCPTDALCLISAQERLAYFNSLTPQDLQASSVLDLCHQAILREYHFSSQSHQLDFVIRYCSNPQFRYSCLEQLQSSIAIDNNRTGTYKRCLPGAGQRSASETCKQNFESLLSNLSQNETDFQFSNTFGFAVGKCNDSFAFNGILLSNINDYSCTSTGARMFYGFSLGSICQSFLFLQSIRVIALVFWWYGHFKHTAHCGNKRREDLIISELSSLDNSFLFSPERFINNFRQMICWHEVGHHLFWKISPLVSTCLEKYGITSWASPNFPSSNDLQAWYRIQNAQGVTSDIIFLLNDFLANISFITSPIFSDYSIIPILRAYHWWLLSAPSPKHRSRGVSWLLELTDSSCAHIGNSRILLNKLLSTTIHSPERLPSLLHQTDQETWSRLSSRHNTHSL